MFSAFAFGNGDTEVPEDFDGPEAGPEGDGGGVDGPEGGAEGGGGVDGGASQWLADGGQGGGQGLGGGGGRRGGASSSGGGGKAERIGQLLQPGVVSTENTLLTIGDAVEHVRAAIEIQLTRGAEEGAKPNESIFGDGAVRSTFYTILGDGQQRAIFLEYAAQIRVWPRLRALFGAPPYHFLHADDGGLIRAAGIARGRSNMVYDEDNTIASYAAFGRGQMMDDFEREYRVLPSAKAKASDPLPWRFSEALGRQLLMQVRVKKRSKTKKMEMLGDATTRQQLTFPRPGDRVQLRHTNGLLQIQRQPRASAPETTVQIRRVVPRGENAATAAVLAVLA